MNNIPWEKRLDMATARKLDPLFQKHLFCDEKNLEEVNAYIDYLEKAQASAITKMQLGDFEDMRNLFSCCACE